MDAPSLLERYSTIIVIPVIGLPTLRVDPFNCYGAAPSKEPSVSYVAMPTTTAATTMVQNHHFL